MSMVVEHMQMLAKFAEQHHYASLEAFVLEHGKPYEGKSLPAELSYGEAKNCFGNAASIALNGHYVYCEGYAYPPGLIPCHHAWLVDPEDGKAIDVTWQDGGRMCGFCLGEKTVEVCVEWDEDGESGWEEQPCDWCKGTGEQDHDHPSRAGTEYYGIEFSLTELSRLILKSGTYGCLEPYVREQLKETA